MLHYCYHRRGDCGSTCTPGSPHRWTRSRCCYLPRRILSILRAILQIACHLMLGSHQTHCRRSLAEPSLSRSWASSCPVMVATPMVSNLFPTCVSRGKTSATQDSGTCLESKLAAGKSQNLLPQSISGHARVANWCFGNSSCRGQLNWLTAMSLTDLCEELSPSL